MSQMDITTLIYVIGVAAAVGAVQWKVLMALYVSPRDYQLDVMRLRLDELSSRLQEAAEVSPAIEQRPAVPAVAQTIVTNRETEERAPFVNPSPGEDPYRSLEAYYSMTHNPDLTEFQKRAVAETTLGLVVTWKAVVRSVSETDDGNYVVFVAPSLTSAADAYCRFKRSDQVALAKLKRGDSVEVAGIISSARGVVEITDCALMGSNADG
jgi:hypothetical protein